LPIGLRIAWKPGDLHLPQKAKGIKKSTAIHYQWEFL
jgi:hypothetical protein